MAGLAQNRSGPGPRLRDLPRWHWQAGAPGTRRRTRAPKGSTVTPLQSERLRPQRGTILRCHISPPAPRASTAGRSYPAGRADGGSPSRNSSPPITAKSMNSSSWSSRSAAYAVLRIGLPRTCARGGCARVVSRAVRSAVRCIRCVARCVERAADSPMPESGATHATAHAARSACLRSAHGNRVCGGGVPVASSCAALATRCAPRRAAGRPIQRKARQGPPQILERCVRQLRAQSR